MNPDNFNDLTTSVKQGGEMLRLRTTCETCGNPIAARDNAEVVDKLRTENERLRKMLIIASEIIHKEAEAYAIWGMEPPQSLLSFLDETKAMQNDQL